jgi:hypothetical protein
MLITGFFAAWRSEGSLRASSASHSKSLRSSRLWLVNIPHDAPTRAGLAAVMDQRTPHDGAVATQLAARLSRVIASAGRAWTDASSRDDGCRKLEQLRVWVRCCSSVHHAHGRRETGCAAMRGVRGCLVVESQQREQLPRLGRGLPSRRVQQSRDHHILEVPRVRDVEQLLIAPIAMSDELLL